MFRKRKDEKEKEINQIILVCRNQVSTIYKINCNIIYMTLFIISVLVWAFMLGVGLYALTALPNIVDDGLDD